MERSGMCLVSTWHMCPSKFPGIRRNFPSIQRFLKASASFAFPSKLFRFAKLWQQLIHLSLNIFSKHHQHHSILHTNTPPTYTPHQFRHGKFSELDEIKSSHETGQEKHTNKLQFFQKMFILLPLVLVTHIMNVGCCLSRLSTDLGVGNGISVS